MTMPAKPTIQQRVAVTDNEDGLDALMQLIDPQDESEEELAAAVAAEEDDVEALLADEAGDDDDEDDDGQNAAAAVGAAGGAAPVASTAAVTGQVSSPDALTRITELADRLAVAEVQRQELAAQTAREAAEARAATAAEARKPKAPFADEDLELTEEERTTYGVSRPAIEKIGKAAVRGYHETVVQPLLDRLAQIETAQGETNVRAGQATDQATMAALRTSVPDLDARVKSPEWQGYISAPMRALGPGVTRGMVLQQALSRGDIEAAAEIISTFEKPAAATPPAGTAPGRAGSGAPASVAAATRRSRDGKTYPYSRFTALAEQAKRGQLTPEKFQQVSDFYMEKYEAGLVDMNS